MKKVIFYLALALVMASCNSGKPKVSEDKIQSSVVSVAPENLSSLKFDVRGMTCTDCENTVSKGVKELPGIAEVTTS